MPKNVFVAPLYGNNIQYYNVILYFILHSTGRQCYLAIIIGSVTYHVMMCLGSDRSVVPHNCRPTVSMVSVGGVRELAC